jgi:hypothetical protein
MLFHIALHTGDDNDNSIDRFDMEAESKENLFDQLETDFFENFSGNREDVMVDGDENSLTLLWSEFYDADGDEVDPDDVDGTEGFSDRTFHHDFYIESD